jgi:hypothetical protein
MMKYAEITRQKYEYRMPESGALRWGYIYKWCGKKSSPAIVDMSWIDDADYISMMPWHFKIVYTDHCRKKYTVIRKDARPTLGDRLNRLFCKRMNDEIR